MISNMFWVSPKLLYGLFSFFQFVFNFEVTICQTEIDLLTFLLEDIHNKSRHSVLWIWTVIIPLINII